MAAVPLPVAAVVTRFGVLVGGVAVVGMAIEEGVAGVDLAGVDLGVVVLTFCDNPLEGLGGGLAAS